MHISREGKDIVWLADPVDVVLAHLLLEPLHRIPLKPETLGQGYQVGVIDRYVATRDSTAPWTLSLGGLPAGDYKRALVRREVWEVVVPVAMLVASGGVDKGKLP